MNTPLAAAVDVAGIGSATTPGIPRTIRLPVADQRRLQHRRLSGVCAYSAVRRRRRHDPLGDDPKRREHVLGAQQQFAVIERAIPKRTRAHQAARSVTTNRGDPSELDVWVRQSRTIVWRRRSLVSSSTPRGAAARTTRDEHARCRSYTGMKRDRAGTRSRVIAVDGASSARSVARDSSRLKRVSRRHRLRRAPDRPSRRPPSMLPRSAPSRAFRQHHESIVVVSVVSDCHRGRASLCAEQRLAPR